jgi:hypothetical protein
MHYRQHLLLVAEILLVTGFHGYPQASKNIACWVVCPLLLLLHSKGLQGHKKPLGSSTRRMDKREDRNPHAADQGMENNALLSV